MKFDVLTLLTKAPVMIPITATTIVNTSIYIVNDISVIPFSEFILILLCKYC